MWLADQITEYDCTVAGISCSYCHAALSNGAAFSVLPRLLPGKRPIGLQGALACIYEDCNGQIKQDMTG